VVQTTQPRKYLAQLRFRSLAGVCLLRQLRWLRSGVLRQQTRRHRNSARNAGGLRAFGWQPGAASPCLALVEQRSARWRDLSMNPIVAAACEHVRVGVGVIVQRDGKVLVGRRKGSHGSGDLERISARLDRATSVLT